MIICSFSLKRNQMSSFPTVGISYTFQAYLELTFASIKENIYEVIRCWKFCLFNTWYENMKSLYVLGSFSSQTKLLYNALFFSRVIAHVFSNSLKSIYRSFRIFFFTSKGSSIWVNIAYILHGTIYSIYAYYMRTVQ